MNRNFTGKHMAAIFVAFFGVVVAVNLTMASLASSTFGGIVVENTYVASQHFNRWLDEAETERALGWQAEVTRSETDKIAISLTGAPQGVTVSAQARHPLGRQAERTLTFEPHGTSRYISRESLADGRWTVRITVSDGTHSWRTEGALR